MAFNLGDRFPPPPKYFTLLDPGAYQDYMKPKSASKRSKAPFLSNTPRNTQSGLKIWTHTLYYVDYAPKISNCTSFMSKSPRFPYKVFSEEDLDDVLCRCGIEKPCECSIEKEQVKCQAKLRKYLFKGHPPRSRLGESLSSPSKTDHGFNVLLDGGVSRIQDKITDESLPFYDTNLKESTSFYQGCKWSKWTSSRSTKVLDKNPGPAHYTLISKPTMDEMCGEKFRSYRRQTSKQMRFIEMVQQRDILEGRPGPATYRPLLPKGTKLEYLGPKANRFPKPQYDKKPGPADHWLQRDFDPIQFSGYSCHAKLPETSCFGVKALRFRPQKEEGPSPASYYPNYRPCNFLRCSTAPFDSFAQRFKETHIEESDEEGKIENTYSKNDKIKGTEFCLELSWQFRSKTTRMQKLNRKFDEPSPADLPQTKASIKRSQQLQHMVPFFSSEGRFQPWYNWMPVHGKLKTPGPCTYSLEKPKCYAAAHRGPVFRALRFPPCKVGTPAPNEYDVGCGIETILKTHNKGLKENIENQHKFVWEPPMEQRRLSLDEQESLLLNKSIALLDTDNAEEKNCKPCTNKSNSFFDERDKPKLLRCFLYDEQMSCF